MILDNQLDDLLFDYFTNDKEVPLKIKEAIQTVDLNKKKKNNLLKFELKQTLATIITFISLSTGIVAFAYKEEITEFISNLFNDSKGVETAIENNYIYSVPENIITESENAKTRIKDMLMDDYILDLNMMITLEDNIDITGFENMKIPDLIITDDTNKILYCSDKNTFDEFCTEKNLLDQYNNINEYFINTSINTFVSSADSNVIHYTLNLSSYENKFPKSKKINVAFKTIEVEKNNKKYTFLGNWKNEIQVPKKFYNRESIFLKVISCNNENIYKNSIIAEVTETGMKFQMSMYWGDYETEQKKSEKMREKNIRNSLLIKDNAYAENTNKLKFYIANSSDVDGGYSLDTSGHLNYWQTFNLTKFDLTDNVKVFLNTINNEKIEIEFTK